MTARRIETEQDVADGLAELLCIDGRLVPVARIAGPLPLRRRPGGFEGLAAIVTAQQISDAAAASIWARFKAAVDPFSPDAFLTLDETAHRAIGLSRPKVRTLTAIATALTDGFDLKGLDQLPGDEAISSLVEIKGIGPWTAEIYLLFCVGHPDIFPAGDLALQIGAELGLGLDGRPTEQALRDIAAHWSPWRGVAARLFWAYYRAVRLKPKVA